MVKTINLSGSNWKLCGMVPDEAHAKRVWENPYAAYPYQWIPATVPGSVQIDLQRAGIIPDWTVDLNSRACEWTSDRQWVYVRHFTAPPLSPSQRAILAIDGVDWHAEVYLNGHLLGSATGMWQTAEWDITDKLQPGENTLVVIIQPAPDQVGQHGHTRDVRHWKPRFAYDWDWCTRLIPLGIFGDVKLIIHPGARLLDAWARPLLDETLRRGTLELSIEAEAAGDLTVRAELEADGKVLTAEAPIRDGQARLSIAVDQPPLWWPNGLGDDCQPLTPLRIELTDGSHTLDSRTLQIGWRKIEYAQNEGAPADSLPYTLIVNGQRMYIRGANWVPIRQLYGPRWLAEYRHWIASAKAACINLLRVWGGGLLERPWFYQSCDRAGILIWQEFLQSSSGITNYPSENPEYINYATSLARHMVRSRRNHPSLAIWCGGNELIDERGVPLDESHPTLKALGDVVRQLDPDRLYLPTSPTGPTCFPDPKLAGTGKLHDVHGHWRFLGDGEHQRVYTTADYLLHSEVGSEGAANLVSLPRFVSPDRLWPPDASNPIWVHHGEWWINREQVEELFGPIADIETFVAASQLLQAEALRFILEEDRRKAWRCSGTIIWQFNEAFPNTSCTNVLDFYGQPKPAYHALARAYGRQLVSARIPRLCWQPGEVFQAEIWAHPPEGTDAGQLSITWRLAALDGCELASGSMSCDLSGDAPIQAGRIAVELDGEITQAAEAAGGPAILTLQASGAFEASNAYPIGIARPGQPALAPFVRQRRAELLAKVQPAGRVQALGESVPSWRVIVRNTGPIYACGVVVRAMGGYATATPGYAYLAPGEALEVTIAGHAEEVRIEAANITRPLTLALPAT